MACVNNLPSATRQDDNKMKNQQGFTLIELVVVIIVLGILAITAAPKFMNLKTDARIAALKGFNGALHDANSLVYSKSAITGKEKMPDTTVELGDGGFGSADIVRVAYGYLQNDIFSIKNALAIKLDDETEWVIEDPIRQDLTVATIIYQQGSPYEKNKKSCHIEYTPAQALGALPTYTLKDTDC